jgi:tripartite-type tricarboxylate transporter receptor subunit TctC
MIPSLPPSIEHIRVGKLRPLAVTAAKPLDALPGVPTISEFVPGYEGNAWVGVGAPKNTPTEIVAKLNQEINLGLTDKRIADRFVELGENAFPGTPAEFGVFIADFTDKVGEGDPNGKYQVVVAAGCHTVSSKKSRISLYDCRQSFSS